MGYYLIYKTVSTVCKIYMAVLVIIIFVLIKMQAIFSNGDSTEELNDLLKTYSEWMTKLKAMSDKNVSHLSEMCIQGYTMGMIKAIQKNHLYCDASKEAKHFGDKLISLHEKSIQDLKKYL